MKIGILTDLHANFPALLAVAEDLERWRPDFVIVGGDTVNRGPRPKECLAFILERAKDQGWLLVRGNHEEYVISRRKPEAQVPGPAFEINLPSYWTYLQLNGNVSALEAMPYQQTLIDPQGNEVRFVHGSMRGLRDGIYPETPDQSLEEKIGLPQAAARLGVFCVGHTHRPLVRSLNNTLVVNAGSAGLPFDGDIRVSYGQLSYTRLGWQARIVRLEYDQAQALQDIQTSGYSPLGGPLVELVQYELAHACSMLYAWTFEFQERILSGEISLEASVSTFMSRFR